MSKNLSTEALNVFGSLDRWIAFHQLQPQIEPLKEHWLTIGAEGLREEFISNPSEFWTCSPWGTLRDTRWVLDEVMADGSISIGIGWPTFELHLFHAGWGREICNRAATVLEEPEYSLVRLLIGQRETRSLQIKEGSIFSIRDFNPLEEISALKCRVSNIAWHAGNETKLFVERTSQRIRQITENPEVVRLLRELRRECLNSAE